MSAAPLNPIVDHRRKWDKDEYERLARERLEKETEEERSEDEQKSSKEKIRREALKPRHYKIDLESKVGKTVVITKTTPAAESGGYYCNVCDCVVKDSINFLDHINGKKHQRNMGMSMKVKKSSLDDVKARLASIKEQKEEKTKEYDLDERLRELQEEVKYKKQKRNDLKKRKRPAPEGDEDQDQGLTKSDMAALMGFAGFGTSKK
uniref:U1-type domain-containing protein n=1 Tax=Romanomermis culicivorax TaxID=13658 RepID=A0A915KCC8_ROMCU